MFKRETTSISDVLKQCLRENGLETPLMQKRAIMAWKTVAGNVVERYTGEIFIRNQTFFVKIVNPALRANLTMKKTSLIAGLNKEAGGKVITDIKIY
ncbi:MAG: DUF721 domain-containing protein [Prevotella sp.]